MFKLKRMLFNTMASTAIIAALHLISKVSTIKEFKNLDQFTSRKYPFAVVMAYTEVKKGMTNEQKKAHRNARRAFQHISQKKIHRRVKIKYAKVNLERVPTVADEYSLKKDLDAVHVLLFNDGHLKAKVPLTLHENQTEDDIYALVDNTIETHLGDQIDRAVEDARELDRQEELERAKYAGAYSYVNPWFDYVYHGYSHPYYYP